MEVKNLIAFFVVLVPFCYSLDVPCVFMNEYLVNDNKSCYIKQTINVQLGEKLNLINTKDVKDILFFIATSPSTLISFPSEICKQLPLLKNAKIEKVGIEILPEKMLKDANKLENLSLKQNKIKNIPANTFSMAPNLRFLYLSNNEIDNIEKDVFVSQSLTFLYLEHNKLVSLKNGIFSQAPKLQTINLNHNSIENIEDGVFDLPHLQELELNNNRLKTLPQNLFANAPQLGMLLMASNQLNEISAVLEKASDLWWINLDDNPMLSDINLMLIRRLPKLEWLSIENINLTLPNTIPSPDSFKSCKLFEFSISRNNLSDKKLLHHLNGLKELNVLYLKENKFTQLDDFEKIKEFLPNLAGLYLEGNKWDPEWVKSAKETCKKISISCYGF